MPVWKTMKVDDLIPHQVMRWRDGIVAEVERVEADWVCVHLSLHSADGSVLDVELDPGSPVEVRDVGWAQPAC